MRTCEAETGITGGKDGHGYRVATCGRRALDQSVFCADHDHAHQVLAAQVEMLERRYREDRARLARARGVLAEPRRERQRKHRPDPARDAWWRKVRAFVMDRAGGTCEARVVGVCSGRAEHCHHIRLRSQGGRDEEHNLLAVCWKCHAYIHANPAESYERGWLRRSGT